MHGGAVSDSVTTHYNSTSTCLDYQLDTGGNALKNLKKTQMPLLDPQR